MDRRTMRSLWWLTYSRDGKLSGVVIVEGNALIDARISGALEEVDRRAESIQGHRLDARCAAMVPTRAIGRMLSIKEAKKLEDRFERKPRPSA
jgi:hypothetical protein